VGHYNSDHPKGRRFTAEELRSHRAKWHEQVKSLNDDINVPSAVTIQKVTGNRNIVAGRDVKIAEKFTTRVEVVPDPGGRHITDAEALQVKQAVAKYSELMKSAELSPNPSRVWGRLYDYFQVTSYKEIPFGRVEEALKIAHTEIAKVRPKIRRRNPEAWRNQYYTAVYAAAGSLSMSKEDVYAFAYEQLRLKKPIGSLKELTQKQLQELDRKMKQMTRG
jgi:hypothetical protein